MTSSNRHPAKPNYVSIKECIVVLSAFVLFVLCAGCTKTIEKSKLQIRGRLAYEINSDKPFSGKVIDKYESGQSALDANYKDGKLEGDYISYYSNGQIKCKAHYREGCPDKEYREYFENGGIKVKQNYVNWVLDGESMEYSDYGTYVTSSYKNGKLNGPMRLHENNGQISQEIIYQNGIKTNESHWNINHELMYGRVFKDSTDIRFRVYENNKVFEVKETYPGYRPVIETLRILDKNNNQIGDYKDAKHWKIDQGLMLQLQYSGMTEDIFQDIVLNNN